MRALRKILPDSQVRFIRVLTLVTGLAGAGCSTDFDPGEQNGPDGGTQSDAGTRVTYVADVQPLLRVNCATCHTAGIVPSPYILFAESYASTQGPSKLCNGDTVGTCIGLAVANQRTEGTGCRTFVTRPFHREPWVCLSEREQMLIAAWVEGGMLER